MRPLRPVGINELYRAFWRERLTPQQRRDTIIASVQLVSTSLLAFGLVSNINTGLVIAIAWTMTSFRR